jgi:two-component system response regulator VicR
MRKKQSPRTILVVDDEVVLTRMLKELLEEEGFLVHTASNGREALKSLAKVRPSIVLSDVMMPEMDGRELYARMQADPSYRTIPVILASAARDGLLLQTGPGCKFLPKPFAIEALLQTISQLLELATQR